MTAGSAVVVALGRVGSVPRPPRRDLRGRLFYVDRIEAVVVPQVRCARGWHCGVVAARLRWPQRPLHVELSDEDLGTASTRMVADPDDVDGLAVVWQSRVFLLDGGGVLSNLGRRLAEDVRMPGALVVDLDAVAVRRLRCGERLVAFGLPRRCPEFRRISVAAP